MRKLKLLASAIFFVAACNNTPATTETTTTDTMQKTATVVAGDTTTQPEYDPAMDGLLVGAQFSKKLADTLNVKMYEVALKPGDSATIHSHPDHAVYVLQGGKLAVYFGGTNRVVMDLPTGGGFVSGPLSDAAKNIGKTTIKLLITDMYRPRGNKNISVK
jgi:hypothetical protein